MSYTTTHEEPLAFSLPEIARMYGVPRKRVRTLAQSGELRTIQLNGRTMVMKHDLLAFFEQRLQAMGIGPPLIPDRRGVN